MKSNRPFFSIVIPVYNGLTHDLPICLESIWNQPLDKELYEVICVDDCSTDNTRQWLREQQELHKNMQIVENQHNIRQGGGRNRGVKQAKGQYIMFIDQDDYFHHDGIAKVYEYIKDKDLDILVVESSYQYKGSCSNTMVLNIENREVMSGLDFLSQNGIALVAPWRMIINRNFYNEHDISFVENTRIEDVDWALKVQYYAKKMQYKPILLIHYIKTNISTTDTMYKNPNTLIDNIQAGNRVRELGDTIFASLSLRNLLLQAADSCYCNSMKYMFGLYCPIKQKKEIIAQIPIEDSNNKLVRWAINNPIGFSIITNLSVPLFRIARYIHRWRVMKKDKNNSK